MRRPVFSRWIKKQVQEIAGVDSLNLRRLAAAAQKDKPRLIEPLLLYAITAGYTDRLISFIYQDDIRESYEQVLSTIKGIYGDLGLIDFEGIALSGQFENTMPREYGKFLASYRTSYNRPETTRDSKRMRWERSRKLQLEKGVSAADIYRALGLNAGNVNAYLKYGDTDKVSLQNANDIMNYLYQY
jgi:hypothetical protein